MKRTICLLISTLMMGCSFASYYTLIETANNDPVQCNKAGWMQYPPYASPILLETDCKPLEVQSADTGKIYSINRTFQCADGKAAHYKFFKGAEAIVFLGCEIIVE